MLYFFRFVPALDTRESILTAREQHKPFLSMVSNTGLQRALAQMSHLLYYLFQTGLMSEEESLCVIACILVVKQNRPIAID